MVSKIYRNHWQSTINTVDTAMKYWFYPHLSVKNCRWVSILALGSNLVALLLYCTYSYSDNPRLFFGYDGAGMLAHLKHQLSYPFAPYLQSLPLQGLGNPPQFNMSAILPFALGEIFSFTRMSPVFYYTCFSTEIFLVLYLFARGLGLKIPMSLSVSWLFVLLYLPIRYGENGYSISQLIPQVVEAIAVFYLLLHLYVKLGQSTLTRDTRIAVSCYFLIFIFCLGQGSWSIVLGVPLVLFCAAQTLFISRNNFIRKTLFTGAVGIVCAATVVPFVLGYVLNAAPQFFSAEMSAGGRDNLAFVSILFHFSNGNVVSFGSALFIMATIGSIATLFISRTSKLAKLAYANLVAQLIILTFGVSVSHPSSLYRGVAPIYFEFFLWPTYILFALVAVQKLMSIMCQIYVQSPVALRIPVPIRFPEGTPVAALMLAVLLPGLVILGDMTAPHTKGTYNLINGVAGDNGVMRVLNRDISLDPQGSKFRGIVATFSGGAEKHATRSWPYLSSVDGNLAATYGNDFRTTGLWWHGIPTYFEYNASLTPAYYFATTRFLTDLDRDIQVRNLIPTTTIHAPYLQSVGTKYMITTAPYESPDAKLVEKLTVPENWRGVFLYELRRPNLGDYSPTRVVIRRSMFEILATMQDKTFDFQDEIVTHEDLNFGSLVRALQVQMDINGSTYSIRSQSPGRSVLLLPVQYSRCLIVANKNRLNLPPRLFRANIWLTGLLFDKDLDVSISYKHGPVHRPFCRISDYREMVRLGTKHMSRDRQTK